MSSGKVPLLHLTIEANTLAAGIYSYTLIVDGHAADIKQMIVTK